MKAKVIGKVLLWVVGALLVLTAGTVALVYTYQDQIIRLFVAEANQHLKTKVAVGKISLSLWEKFPQVALTLDQVQVTESVPGSNLPLATATRMYCTFSLQDILRKQYRVRELYLENGTVAVRVLPGGEVNYHVLAPDTTAQAGQPLSFDLEKISLKNMQVSYADGPGRQYYQVKAHDLQAALAVKPGAVTIRTEGRVLVQTMQLGADQYFRNKETFLRTALVLYPEKRQLELSPSLIKVGPASYELRGNVDYAGAPVLDLELQARNTNIQSLLALLPEKMSRPLRQYRSRGSVYFTGQLKGSTAGRQSPQIAVQFGCRQATFYHPDYKQQITNVSLTGSFTNGAGRNAQTSVLSLQNLQGKLENRPFAGNLVLRNFGDPFLDLDLKATLDVAHVLGLFPQETIRQGSGLAKVAVTFAGKVRALKAGPGGGGVQAGGDITLQHVNLQLRDYAQPFRQLNGLFLIRRQDLAVTNFKGYLGTTDFLLNGYFKNVLGWIFLPKQSLLVEADFESRFLDLDQLLSSSLKPDGGKGSAPAKKTGAVGSGGSDYKLVISPYLDFNLNAQVQRLHFRRFHGQALRGNIRLKNQVISSPDMALQVLGGRFGLRGFLDARRTDNIKVNTVTSLQDIRVDSLFYVFENFGQDFLQQRHLQGELTASINSDLYFDSHLNAKTNQMEAEIQARIRNGQLNNFEPLQKLSAFADRRELANLHFSELSNTFYIQSRTVYIPEMEIRSNVARVSAIGIQGTHTFDQVMDYRFRIPIAGATPRRDKDEAYGRVAQVAQGPTNLFLTLKGTESNFKIAYDQERVKNKVAADLQREKKELTDILKGKKPEVKKKEVELETGEYFEF